MYIISTNNIYIRVFSPISHQPLQNMQRSPFQHAARWPSRQSLESPAGPAPLCLVKVLVNIP